MQRASQGTSCWQRRLTVQPYAIHLPQMALGLDPAAGGMVWDDQSRQGVHTHVHSPPLYSHQVPLKEKLALLDFKEAMLPPGRAVYLNNWLPGTDPCDDEWQGVVCDCVQV